jgi:restriction system protein
MPVPDFQSMMLPILTILKDGHELIVRELTSKVAEHFHLTEEERREQVPSGTQTQLVNRVAWAKIHMQRAGLLQSPRRAAIQITSLGSKVLNESPTAISCRYLKQFPSYVAFTTPKKAGDPTTLDHEATQVLEATVTPKELIETSIQTLYKATVADLRDRLRQSSSGFFEIESCGCCRRSAMVQQARHS